MSRGLRRLGASSVEALRQLNVEEVARVVGSWLHARTLTIDVDSTVLCTGSKVGGAARGYNPHHRKVPSYYPATAFLAESGVIQRPRTHKRTTHWVLIFYIGDHVPFAASWKKLRYCPMTKLSR